MKEASVPVVEDLKEILKMAFNIQRKASKITINPKKNS